MKISCAKFINGSKIPSKYTCDGEDINPPLLINKVSKETVSLALIVDDPDSPFGIWSHWVIWNISSAVSEISEGEIPHGATEGTNSFGEIGYGGPCPGSGAHRYYFRLYALSKKMNLEAGATKEQLLNEINSSIVSEAEIWGTYERKK